MKTFEVKVEKTLKFTEEDLNDILCSCFEGGCGYWACLDNSTAEWDEARNVLRDTLAEVPTMEDIMVYLLLGGENIVIYDQEDGDERHSFNLDDFLKGISMSVNDGFWDGDDTCDVDGIVGDAIIQYAVFGGQIYG